MKGSDANDLITNLMACAANDTILVGSIGQNKDAFVVDSFEFYFNQS